MLAIELFVGVALCCHLSPHRGAERASLEGRMLATANHLPSAFRLEVSRCQLRVTKTSILFCIR